MDSGKKRGGILCITCGDPLPALEVEKSVFHQAPQFVEVLVILSLLLPIFAGRDLGLHALLVCLFNNGVIDE